MSPALQSPATNDPENDLFESKETNRHVGLALCTDFGEGDIAVSEIKNAANNVHYRLTGKLPNILSEVHTVDPQSIPNGSFVLRQQLRSLKGLRPSTGVVVDPGVGTERKLLAVEFDDPSVGTVIIPDNGVISLSAKEFGFKCAWVIDPRFGNPNDKTQTFHGRSKIIPAATFVLAERGLEDISVGRIDKQDDLHSIEVENGTAVHVDPYGNVKFEGIHPSLNDKTGYVTVELEGKNKRPIRVTGVKIVNTFGEALPNQPVIYVGSSGGLELAIVNGNAAKQFGIKNGDKIISLHSTSGMDQDAQFPRLATLQ